MHQSTPFHRSENPARPGSAAGTASGVRLFQTNVTCESACDDGRRELQDSRPTSCPFCLDERIGASCHLRIRSVAGCRQRRDLTQIAIILISDGDPRIIDRQSRLHDSISQSLPPQLKLHRNQHDGRPETTAPWLRRRRFPTRRLQGCHVPVRCAGDAAQIRLAVRDNSHAVHCGCETAMVMVQFQVCPSLGSKLPVGVQVLPEPLDAGKGDEVSRHSHSRESPFTTQSLSAVLSCTPDPNVQKQTLPATHPEMHFTGSAKSVDNRAYPAFFRRQ